jgi:hypothetical protein
LDGEDTDEVIRHFVTFDDRHRDVARISRVIEDPRPFFIATLVYLPRGEAVRRLEAVSPFSQRLSPQLRAWIAREAKENKGLMSWIRSMASDAYAKADTNEVLMLAEADARSRVEEALPATLRTVPSIELDSLLDPLWRAEEDAERSAKAPGRGRDVASKAGEALERFIRLLNAVEEFRHYKAANLVPRGPSGDDHKAETRLLVSRAVEELTGRRAPSGLLNGSQPKNLRRALQPNDRESARARMAAMALHAKFIEAHPLRVACHRDPELIIKFDQVYAARNDGTHDNPRVFSSEEARGLLRDTYDVLERLAEGWLAALRMDQQITETR